MGQITTIGLNLPCGLERARTSDLSDVNRTLWPTELRVLNTIILKELAFFSQNSYNYYL